MPLFHVFLHFRIKNPLETALRTINSQDWIAVILVIVFALLAVSRSLYPRRFQEFIMLPITDKYFNLQGKGYEINHPFNVLLFVIQMISFSLFFFVASSTFSPSKTIESPILFIQICTGFSVFVLMKFISEKIIAHIFNIEKTINRYLYEKLSYTSLISWLLLASSIVFLYAVVPTTTVLWVAMVVFGLLFAISLVSSFKRNGNVILKHFFYFILYLCALEIAPYIILYYVLI